MKLLALKRAETLKNCLGISFTDDVVNGLPDDDDAGGRPVGVLRAVSGLPEVLSAVSQSATRKSWVQYFVVADCNSKVIIQWF